jgi:hypothetical protein
MKTLIIGTILAAVAVSAAAQQTYEMRCRGGSGLSLTTPPSFRIDASGKGTVLMTLKFVGGPQRAKIGSDGTRLNPGQCSWVDRDLRPGEPTVIKFDLLYISFDGQNARNGSDQATEEYPDSKSLPGYLASPNHYWSFRVYNTGKGYMRATSSKVFKPALKRAGPDVLR